MAAGKLHSIAIGGDGEEYTFGCSREWQTGQGTRVCINTPTKVSSTEMKESHVRFADASLEVLAFAGTRKGSE